MANPSVRKWNMRRATELVLHPFLAAIYPAIALLAININQLRPTSAYRSLVLVLAAITILLILYRLLLRNWHRAGILSSLTVILFFSYGHLYQFVRSSFPFGLSIARHRVLIPLWIAILVGGVWVVAKKVQNPRSITRGLNFLLLFLLVVPAFQLADFGIRSSRAWLEAPPELQTSSFQPQELDYLPDIYYIILDGYGRQDVLAEYYGYDNSAFLDWLSDAGFVVAQKSQSNYAQTELSLASSLNMDYLQSLRDDFQEDNTDRSMLWPLIRESTFRRVLEEFGYVTVAFETGFMWTQFEDADFYITRNSGVIAEFYAFGQMNAFEALLIQNSAFLIMTDAVIVVPKILTPDVQAPFRDHRERILFVLDKLSEAPTIKGPKFTFAHLVIPHKPFVFAPDDDVELPKFFTLAETEELNDDESYITGYINQVVFINTRMQSVLGAILANSDKPPIIILQADHGPGHFGSNRMAILNAYYLPDRSSTLIYEEISPVNTFRIVLNEYFGANYPLLEDISYFSTYDAPYDFNIISD